MCGICGCGHDEDHHHDHKDATLIKVEQDLLAKNDQYAHTNREYFKAHQINCLNLLASPGAGKTTLLVETLKQLKHKMPVAVIEGDQQTDLDAARIAALDVSVKQINTGKSCHLDAHQIGHAVSDLALMDKSLLFVENVGNLVCPALFDLGEAHRVVILSVTEGDDKPLKYPYMFDGADLLVFNKIDLLPYVSFDLETCEKYAKQINPNIKSIALSATTGEGVEQWIEWLCHNNVTASL